MNETIGGRLKQVREQRHITLQQASETTKIRTQFLEALENDDLSGISSTAQARGFLRIYGEFLGLSVAELSVSVNSSDEDSVTTGEDTVPSAEVHPGSAPDVVTPRSPAKAIQAKPQTLGFLGALRSRLAPHSKIDTDGSSNIADSAQVQTSDSPASPSDSKGITSIKPSTISKYADQSADIPDDIKKRTQINPADGLDSVAESTGESAGGSVISQQTLETPASRIIPNEINDEIETIKSPDAEIHAAKRITWVSKLRTRFEWVKPNPLLETTEAQRLDSADNVAKADEPGISNAADFNPLPPEVLLLNKTSSEIFAEIGATLRHRREMLSLTIEEVERHTRIKTTFLQALENGGFVELPSPVQTRGILANYAAFLDLDTDVILLRFADGLQLGYRERGQGQPSRKRTPMNVHTTLPPWRSFIASDLLFGGGMAIILLLFSIWGISRVMTVRSSIPSRATSLSISDVLAGTALPTLAQEVTLIPAQESPLASESGGTATFQVETLAANVKVQVMLTATQSTYMRVTVDGKVQFEGRAETGSAYPYQAAKQIEVLVGNAAALKVTFNGKDQGLMGNFGEVVDRVYTAAGAMTPTSTQPPTPTFTPKVTTTPSQTPTRTPTITPSPKPGE